MLRDRWIRAAFPLLALGYLCSFAAVIFQIRQLSAPTVLFDQRLNDGGKALAKWVVPAGDWIPMAAGLGLRPQQSATLIVPIDKPASDAVLLRLLPAGSATRVQRVACSTDGTTFTPVEPFREVGATTLAFHACPPGHSRVWVRVSTSVTGGEDRLTPVLALEWLQASLVPPRVAQTGTLGYAAAARFDLPRIISFVTLALLAALCVSAARTPLQWRSIAGTIGLAIVLASVMDGAAAWPWAVAGGLLLLLWWWQRERVDTGAVWPLADLTALCLVGVAATSRWQSMLGSVYRELSPDSAMVAHLAREMAWPYDTQFREPLWVWLARGMLAIVPDSAWAMPLFSFLFSVAALLMVYVLVREYLRKPAIALVTLMFLAVHDYLIYTSSQGHRTELYIFLLAAFAYGVFVPAERLSAARRGVVVSASTAALVLTQLGSLPVVTLLLLWARFRHGLSWRWLLAPVVIAVALLTPHLMNSARQYGDPLWSQNMHAMFYRNYEYLARQNTTCDGCPTPEEYARSSYAGRAITMADYIFGMHSPSEVVSRVVTGYLELFVRRSSLLSAFLGLRPELPIYLLYLAGCLWLLVRPARELLLVPLLSLNMLAFIIPLGDLDPRLLIHASPFGSLALACGTVALVRFAFWHWRDTPPTPQAAAPVLPSPIVRSGNSVKLSVVMPVYNEHVYIDEIIRRVDAIPIDKEIILIDDCSTDGTREHLQRRAQQPAEDGSRLVFLFHEVNQGKGAALRTAFAHAKGDIVIVQDADLEYDPKDYVKLIEPIEHGRADVVYGSRFLGAPHRALLFWHTAGNRLLTLISNIFNDLNLTDMETCYKAFRREVLDHLTIRENRFGFEPEFTAKVAKLGCRIYEVPISYDGRTYSEGKKIGWRDGVSAIRCIIWYGLTAPRRKGLHAEAKSPARVSPVSTDEP